MNIMKELGLIIRCYRKEKHMTQEHLAEISGLHPTYIGQIERGEKNATIESIYRIAKGLDIPISKLLENIEYLESHSPDISLDIYQSILTLPLNKQKQVSKILHDIIELLND